LKNYWITTGAVFGFLGVAIGAFGAHQVKNLISPEMMEIYKTGVLYHLIHAAVILAIGFYGNQNFFKGALFISIGIILFSFSLYVYSVTSITTIAIITPFGGVSFLLGWLLIIAASVKKTSNV
jgi:uncharacterized membrane protein YgdD (TMEM256/DUF423 family)